MKVGILTWRGGYNYGTNLQSYALQHLLKNRFRVDAELIDYVADAGEDCLEKKNLSYILDGFISRVRVRIDRYIKLRKAKYYNHLYASEYKIKGRNVESFCRKITFSSLVSTPAELSNLNNIYDAFICGSDQIWNPTHINRRYFLDFAERGKRIISYAPSLGTKRLPRYMHNKYRELLKGFTAISTRESLSAQTLSKVLKRDVFHTLDPVFLLSLDEWMNLAKYSENSEGDYLLCYFISDNRNCYRDAERYAREHNLKIISLVVGGAGGFEIKGATIDVESGPQEFLGLIEKATCVMTNSFHCVAFSILYHKDFYAFSANMHSEMADIDFRFTDLLSLFDIEERFVGNNLYRHIDDIGSIDYLSVQAMVDNKKEESISFLKRSLLD